MAYKSYAAAKDREEYGIGPSYGMGSNTGFTFSVDKAILDESIREVIKDLEKIAGEYLSDKALMKIFKPYADMFRKELRTQAPKGTRTRKHTYADGTTTTFTPGNLRRSMTVFRGKKRFGPAYHIGPRRYGAPAGNKKADGYYGVMIDRMYGSKHRGFLDRAFRAKRDVAEMGITHEIEQIVMLADRDFNSFLGGLQ